MNIITYILIVFAICLIIRIPIGYSIAITCLAVIIKDPTLDFSFYVSSVYNGTNNLSIMAIPFFMFAGEIMGVGGIANRLVVAGKKIIGNIHGSLGVILVLGCAFFAAISGSAPATVAAIGGIVAPMMIKEGYPKEYASALAAAGGTLGPVIPPSIIMVTYGIMTNTSITELFMAGILPGLLMVATLILYNIYYCRKFGYDKPTTLMNDSDTVQSSAGADTAVLSTKYKVSLYNVDRMSIMQIIKYSWLSLLAPVIILGGIYGGVFTATEAGVISVVYSFLVCFFIYKEITLSDVWIMAKKAASTSSSVLVIIGPALLFGRLLAFNHVPQMINEFFMTVISTPWVFLLFINILFLILGCFMEALAAIMIFAPLLAKIAVGYGISPVHFGIILTVNLVIGLLTPPVGINLFVASGIAGVPLHKMIKPVTPMFIIFIIDLLLITYIDQITMILPSILM